ncbi:MFS transporter [Bryobacter aggregatus]|uniref:MFS transporter n=1 Tax=Bryobacter aggregatus TaxID=360054 RepID=UPI00192E3D34|nr:MFS transporter [Bryobacter aggregatus]
MKNRHWVLVLLFFLSVITYIDRVCISVAGPTMQDELHLSQTQWGWVVGAFTLSYALFEIPTGAMGDRLGSRITLSRIVLWWSGFTALTGAVSNFYLLLLTRFLFGIGEAGAYPNAASTISRWFPKSQRARAASVVWAASRLGGAVSPFLVIPIQQAYGWRASFYIFGSIGLVWVAIWYFWFRDTPATKPGTSTEEIAEIAADSSPGDAAHTSMPWKKALKNSNYWMILLMYHTYCWGSFFYLSWLHTFLVKGRGMSQGEMKSFSALPFIVGFGGNLLGGFLSDFLSKKFGLKIGRRTVGAAGLALSGLCMLATAYTPDRFMAVGFLALGYGFMDCMLPVSWAICLDVGKRYAGALSGSMNMAGQLGSFGSSVAFGYLVDYFQSYDVPLKIFSVFLLLSAFLFTRIDPTRELSLSESEEAVPATL